MMFRNKVLWVIGANSDIARAFVSAYVGRFKKTVLASRDISALTAFAKTLETPARALPLDVADADSRRAFLEAADTPDIILLCAGHVRYQGGTEDVSEENILQTFSVNTTGQIALLEAAAPALRARGDATVMALTSCAGDRGKASNRVYAASKGGMTVYLEGFMQENAPYGVKTMIVKPGHVRTKMAAALTDKVPVFSCSPEAAAAALWKRMRRNRSGTFFFPRIWAPLMFVYKRIPSFLYRRFRF